MSSRGAYLLSIVTWGQVADLGTLPSPWHFFHGHILAPKMGKRLADKVADSLHYSGIPEQAGGSLLGPRCFAIRL